MKISRLFRCLRMKPHPDADRLSDFRKRVIDRAKTRNAHAATNFTEAANRIINMTDTFQNRNLAVAAGEPDHVEFKT